MNHSLLRLPPLGVLLVFAVSCGVEEYASPDPAPHTADQQVGEGRTPPPVLDVDVPTRAVDSPRGEISRWKYTHPPHSVGPDGTTVVDACLITTNTHSVVLARVLEEPVVDRTTCPSPYREPWHAYPLQILEVVAGYPVPTQITGVGLLTYDDAIHKGDLRLILLRRTEREWVPTGSFLLMEESTPGYAAWTTPEHVHLSEELEGLRTQLTGIFERYDEPGTCPGRTPWQSDEAFAAFLYAPGEHCAEPFVDPLQEP